MLHKMTLVLLLLLFGVALHSCNSSKIVLMLNPSIKEFSIGAIKPNPTVSENKLKIASELLPSLMFCAQPHVYVNDKFQNPFKANLTNVNISLRQLIVRTKIF